MTREMVDPADARPVPPAIPCARPIKPKSRESARMYVIVVHQINNPEVAFSRGERLIKNEGAPNGVRGLQFYPSTDGSAVTCLWEADSVRSIQEYVDSTLGDS